MRVGLIVMATGRYRRFLPQLVASAETYVDGLDRIFVLSDDGRPTRSSRLVTKLSWDHAPWPLPTLLRYRAITEHADRLSEVDVLVYVDVDMRFVAPFVLPEMDGLFAVEHPGCLELARDQLPFERDPASRAFVPFGSGDRYVCGGVQGGRTQSYLAACAAMAQWVDDEREAGRIPIWHDESIWNRWCIEHPPQVVLPVSYCWPEHRPGGEPVLLALDKTHDYWRAESSLSACLALIRSVSRRSRVLLWRLLSNVARLPRKVLRRES